MKIEFHKLTEFQQHFIIECYTHLSKEDGEKLIDPTKETGIHDLRFTDNGVELNPLDFIDEWTA